MAKDYSQIIDVAYGTHKIVVSADGYEPYSQIISVEDIFKEFNITLVKAEETPATTRESNSETDESSSDKESNSAQATKKTNVKETTTMPTIDYGSLINSLFGN